MYGLPLPIDRLGELAGIADKLSQYDGNLRVLIDNPAQVQAVESWTQQEGKGRRWSAFIKCDAGGK
jgi:D-serine deaminase-like pyridoxal phosphate-dependent protein